jgi:glucan phosphoethanolaminetransferase (alkaline phosphatase superfamily)
MNSRKAIWSLLTLSLALLPNLLWMLSSSPMNAFKLGLAPSLALVIGLVAWSGRRPGVAIALVLPFSVLLPAECYYIWNFQSPSSVHILGIVGETNLREAREYLGDRTLVLVIGASIASLLLFSYSLWTVGLRYAFPAGRAWRWVGLAATLPVLSLIAFESAFALKGGGSEQPATWGAAQSQQFSIMLKDVNLKVSDVLSPGFPFGVPLRFWSYQQERQRLAVAKATLDAIPVNAVNRPGAADEAVVVLVIGESANSLNWGVNGYPKDTTPRISAMSDAVSLSNVVTPWTATRLSVPIFLTGQQDNVSGLSPLTAPSLLATFKAAGWKTYWLSNQSPLGQHDSVIGLYAAQADVVKYLSGADFMSSASTDDVLLEPVMKALKFDPAPRKLIVVHLLGSHAEYQLRYPREFNKFRPSGTDAAEPGELKTLMNSYDNSIFFTDHILAELIGFLRKAPEKSNVSLVYASDHGQAIPTYECPQWGHSPISEYSYRVPALIWMSPESQRRNQGAIERLKVARDRPLHTNQIFDTVLDLAQIDSPSASSSKSWVNADWQPTKRMVRTGVDFDSIEFGGSCRVARSQIDRQP